MYEYKTRDIWLASALVASGLELLRAESISRPPSVPAGLPWTMYVVADGPARPVMVEEYMRGALSCSVVGMKASFKRCTEARAAADVVLVRGAAIR